VSLTGCERDISTVPQCEVQYDGRDGRTDEEDGPSDDDADFVLSHVILDLWGGVVRRG
jgi:hypothetical protein